MISPDAPSMSLTISATELHKEVAIAVLSSSKLDAFITTLSGL